MATVLFSMPAAALSKEGKFALTFDDLPALTIVPDQKYVDNLNKAILRKLLRQILAPRLLSPLWLTNALVTQRSAFFI